MPHKADAASRMAEGFMAGETTVTPVAADISPTVIAGVKERSTRWIAALTAAPDGFTLAASMTCSRHWKHSTTNCGHLSFR